jgi:hypothetical protein
MVSPLALIKAHLIVGFFGCCCVLNRIDVGRGSMMLTIFGMGWGDRQRCKEIGRFVLTILWMAWTIVVLQYFFKIVGWVGNDWVLRAGGCFFWFGWEVAEGAVFVGDIGVGEEVVVHPVASKL